MKRKTTRGIEVEILLSVVVISIGLWMLMRKFSGKAGEDTSLNLALDVSGKYQLTQAQAEKAINCATDIEYLLENGFSLTENSTDRISLKIEKEDYYCEYNNYYELDGKKVKKVVSELTGEWKFNKKTKSIKGGTNDAFQKWLDFDYSYEEAIADEKDRLLAIEQDRLEKEEDRLFAIEQERLDGVGKD